MSTELKPIKTSFPIITATRLWGGKEGASIQLGQNYWETGEYGFIQISAADAPILAQYLLDFHKDPMNMPEEDETEAVTQSKPSGKWEKFSEVHPEGHVRQGFQQVTQSEPPLPSSPP